MRLQKQNDIESSDNERIGTESVKISNTSFDVLDKQTATSTTGLICINRTLGHRNRPNARHIAPMRQCQSKGKLTTRRRSATSTKGVYVLVDDVSISSSGLSLVSSNMRSAGQLEGVRSWRRKSLQLRSSHLVFCGDGARHLKGTSIKSDI